MVAFSNPPFLIIASSTTTFSSINRSSMISAVPSGELPVEKFMKQEVKSPLLNSMVYCIHSVVTAMEFCASLLLLSPKT